MDKKNISDYFDNDVPSFGSYDNIRKICGFDGLKNSQRKLIWTGFKRCNGSWIKTDTMCAQTQIDTVYIHGAGNLEVVIDNMAASYVGSNNYPLFTGNSGGFGCRISPRASAGRYTRISLSDISKQLFNPIDNEIIEKQYFEGQYIEPKFLVPIFPVVFLNGSEGMSTGFSHVIYPRNPKEVITYIKKKLNGTASPKDELLPWFKGHLGKVEYNPTLNRNESFGVIVKNNMTSYTITEIPIGIEYQKYVEYLDKLCDTNVIVDYEDKCDPKTDKICFEIKTTREFTKRYPDDRSLYEVFHLIKSLPETLCCIDRENRAREFSSIKEILDDYIEYRYKFYTNRKNYILQNLKFELGKLVSKFVFCKAIIDKTLAVSNRKKTDIVSDLEKIDKIIKIDGNYDYLLRLPISQITKEEIERLKELINTTKNEFLKIKSTSEKDMWIDDLNKLEKYL